MGDKDTVVLIGASNDAPTTTTTTTPPSTTPKCTAPIMPQLRYNTSGRMANQYLPFGFPAGTTLAQAICCDIDFEAFAEPKGFYAYPGIDLFGRISDSGVTTFYDSATGLPVFRAPVNRTLADFEADTKAHGWQ